MAHLLIIELPGGNDVDILQAALDRGDEFTFLSAQLGHYRRQPAVATVLDLASELIEVSSFEDIELERCARAVHARHPIDAVLCLVDIRLRETARLADQLGLRFLNPASAALLRDKFSVRCRLAERGLAQPEFALAESNHALQEAVDRLGLPVLIKPADGYGSQNIVVLRYPEDLDPLLSPLGNLLPCRADYGLGVRANDRLLVERFMGGQLIGCDTFSLDGKHTLIGVHEKLMFEPPSFAMRGSCFTPHCAEFELIERYVKQALDAVDFDCGAAHLELMLTEDGPRLVEINARLVGAKIARLVGCTTGRSLHDELIALHLGRPASVASAVTGRVGAIRWIVADHPGILERVEMSTAGDPRICCVEILKQPGDHVRPPMDNADRIGYVMVCAATREEAERVADSFVSDAVVVMQASTAAPA